MCKLSDILCVCLTQSTVFHTSAEPPSCSAMLTTSALTPRQYDRKQYINDYIGEKLNKQFHTKCQS